MKRTLFALAFLSLLFGLTGFSIKVYMAEGTENPAMPCRNVNPKHKRYEPICQ